MPTVFARTHLKVIDEAGAASTVIRICELLPTALRGTYRRAPEPAPLRFETPEGEPLVEKDGKLIHEASGRTFSVVHA